MRAHLPTFGHLLDDLATADASQLRDRNLTPQAPSFGPNAEEAYMTIAEQLRAEGRAEALAEGRAEALMQVLTVKFGTLPADVPEKVRAASSGQVQKWTARAVTAEKLDEVFG